MEILVCLKQVPASSKVEVDPVTGVLKRDGADAKMNPYDLFALETAFRLREAVGGRVTVLTMGPPQASEIIREAYAMGADAGVILSDRAFAGADVLATSYTLASGARASGNFDLILCGKQTTDGDTAQVGSEMAEVLGLPSLANVTSVSVADEKTLAVTMDMGDSVMSAKVALPALIAVDKDICEPRLPSYKRKKETAGKEIRMITANDIENIDRDRLGLHGSPTQVARVFPPEKTAVRETWTGSGEELASRMASRLEEAKFF